MATTIQVSDATRQLLELLKVKRKAASFDQVIDELAREKVGVPHSMFGSVKGLQWKKQDRMRFHEL